MDEVCLMAYWPASGLVDRPVLEVHAEPWPDGVGYQPVAVVAVPSGTRIEGWCIRVPHPVDPAYAVPVRPGELLAAARAGRYGLRLVRVDERAADPDG